MLHKRAKRATNATRKKTVTEQSKHSKARKVSQTRINTGHTALLASDPFCRIMHVMRSKNHAAWISETVTKMEPLSPVSLCYMYVYNLHYKDPFYTCDSYIIYRAFPCTAHNPPTFPGNDAENGNRIRKEKAPYL